MGSRSVFTKKTATGLAMIRSGLAGIVLFVLAFVPPGTALSASEQKSAQVSGDFVIALLVSSYEGKRSERVEAIKFGAQLRIDEINAAGGIRGTPVRLLILDDHKDPEFTIQNIDQALAEKRLIAIIGLDSSTRGAAVVEKIGASGVPFISDISLDRMFAPHTNIFSMTSSISGDTKVLTRFLGENFRKTIFVGRKDELFAKEFHIALAKQNRVELAGVHWTSRDAKKFDAEIDGLIEELKDKRPDILCVAVFSHQGAILVRRLAAAGIDIPVYFVTGSVYSIVQKNASAKDAAGIAPKYKGSLFGIGRGIPNVEGERLAHLNTRAAFQELRQRYPDYLGNGIIYSDLLSLVASTVQKGEKASTDQDIPALRKQIVAGLTSYRRGKKTFRGVWRNWSFTRARSSALGSYVLWAPGGGPELKLWPVQYVHTLAGVQKTPVAFVNVDLVRIDQIDTNHRSFGAEFYLSLSSSLPVDISNMEFNNVIRGDDGAPFLNIREIHKGQGENPGQGTGAAASLHLQKDWINRLYVVKGQFRFKPELGQYPFDSQRFSIAIQPKNTTSPFLVQPAPALVQSSDSLIEGWRIHDGRLGQYVGYEEDYLNLVRNYGADQQTMPYYRFNFSWVAQRLTRDYMVRVVLPLGLILLVAYFSVFLPARQIDSVVAMQITALLSTIALYFSIPKLETETATLSDQVFVFAELIIVVMIFLSIVRVNAVVREAHFVNRVLFGVDVIVFPLLTFLMYRYVSAVGAGTIKSITDEPVAGTLFKLLPRIF